MFFMPEFKYGRSAWGVTRSMCLLVSPFLTLKSRNAELGRVSTVGGLFQARCYSLLGNPIVIYNNCPWRPVNSNMPILAMFDVVVQEIERTCCGGSKQQDRLRLVWV